MWFQASFLCSFSGKGDENRIRMAVLLQKLNRLEDKMNYTILVMMIYAAVMLLSTVLLTRREKSVMGFCVGNRNIGWIVSALSIAATWIWAPALFTSTETAYTKGFAGLFWFLVPNVLCLILFIPFAKKIRKEMPEGVTLSGYMHSRYRSKSVKNVYLFQLVALLVLSTGVQLLAGSKILSRLTGIPFWCMTIVMAVVAFTYSQFSGIRASIMTDAIQMVFMLVSSIGFVAFGVKNGGGPEMLLTGLRGATGDAGRIFSASGWEIFLGFGLPTTIGLMSGPFGDQCFWQRAFCVKKDRIGRAFLAGALLFGIVPLSMGILGFIGAGIGYTATDTGMINFDLISTLFPEWAVIPFLFMIISGLLSTIDSNLCAVSSLMTDVFLENTMGKTKLSMILLLVAGIAVANIPGLTVTHLFLMYGTLRASTLLPTVLTLKGVRLAPQGIVAGVIAAMMIGLPVFGYGNISGTAVYKTTGSLLTVILSGVIAIAVSRMRGVNYG